MKSIIAVVSLMLLVLLGGTTSAAAQEETSRREVILASIPTLANFEEQADATFVGDVEGSYAFIAFVVRDGFAVVYLCDNVLSHWLSGEIVDGTLNMAAEDGTRIVATISDDHIEGTVTLTTDDDGGEASPHAFTAVPAVPGQTGLVRLIEPFDKEINFVSGWIVTNKGIRGRRGVVRVPLNNDICGTWHGIRDTAATNLVLENDPATYAVWMDVLLQADRILAENGC